MQDSNGDAGPGQFPVWSRRKFLLASASVALLAACRRSDTPADRTQPDRKHASPAAAALPSDPAADAEFLQLSIALTGKPDLDPFVAARIRAALAALEPATLAQLPALKQLASSVDSPARILAAAGTDSRAAALSIVAAWYTGTVGKGTSAVTVAYRDALMQRPVADGLYPQTYAMGGPGWWVAAPPPAITAG